MEGICSCGTVLVEGASFCHRCGKAQREFLVAEPEAEPETPQLLTIPPPPTFLPVSFANSAAVRIGFLTASVASMLDAVPFVILLFPIWSALAGYFSVMIYRKRTGQPLTVVSGARMGWITGVLNAVIVLVFLVISFMATLLSKTSLLQQMQEKDPTNFAVIAGYLQSPYSLAALIVFCMLFMFAGFTLAGIAGGALGAKFAKKD